ncbi:MAG: helix-turn-helix domain-containing protein [Qipengyuania sp.]
MANHFCLPDVRLISEIVNYQVVTDAFCDMPFYPAGMIAFNMGKVPIRLDGESYADPCLFCLAVDPAMMTVNKEEGEVVIVNLRAGAFFRLLGLDGTKHEGRIVAADIDRYPALFGILDALNQAPKSVPARIAALDGGFLPLAEQAEAPGLGEKFRFMADWTKGNIRVGKAAEKLGVSVRTLERECRRRFARTPKRILRGFRISHAMAPANSQGESVRWNALDPGALYSDQSHFLREHRALSGLNPTELKKRFDNRGDELIWHRRDDASIGGTLDDPDLAAEYEEADRYSHFGPHLALELGLGNDSH